MADDVVNTTPNVVDAEKISADAVAKAEAKADEKIEAAREYFDKKLEGVEEKATTKALESIVEAISGKEEKWVPKSYEEITEKAKADTLAEVNKKLEARDAKAVAEAKKTQEAATKRDEDYNKYWDGQLDKIAAVDDSFKVSEETTKALEGKQLKQLTASEMQDLREADKGFDKRIKLQEEAFGKDEANLELYYYKEFRGKKSGTTAPVITGSKAVTPTDKSDFDYADIHGKKPSDILMESQE